MPKSDSAGVYLRGQAFSTPYAASVDRLEATARVQRGDARWVNNGRAIQMLKDCDPQTGEPAHCTRQSPCSLTHRDMEGLSFKQKARVVAKLTWWGAASENVKAVHIVPREFFRPRHA